MKPQIYLATVGIEKNRWKSPRTSSIDLYQIIEDSAQAGFAGLEIWEYHLTSLSDSELTDLHNHARKNNLTLAILNTYLTTENTPENIEHRNKLSHIANHLGITRLKYNLNGTSPDSSLTFVKEWQQKTNFELLCECHPGTFAENPEIAANIFYKTPKKLSTIQHWLLDSDEVFEKSLKKLADRTTHVHLQYASEYRSKLTSRIPLLHTHIPHLTWSIEFTSPVKNGASNQACLQASIEDLQLLHSLLLP